MVMYLDFSRTFDIIFHPIHICKLTEYGLDKLMIRELENWRGHDAERVVGSGLKAQLVAGHTVLQSLVLFGIFVESLDDETKIYLQQICGQYKTEGEGGAADMLNG